MLIQVGVVVEGVPGSDQSGDNKDGKMKMDWGLRRTGFGGIKGEQRAKAITPSCGLSKW